MKWLGPGTQFLKMTYREILDGDDCASNPCAEGATCVDRPFNYTCVCPPNSSGRNCEGILTHYNSSLRVGNAFSHVCVCVSVCLSVHLSLSVCVCLYFCGYNFLTPSHRNFIFGIQVHLYNIKVKFEYQGHWVKVKII